MHNLRHFYYQNKEKIWKVVLLIAFLLGIIYFLNQNAIENNNQFIENTSINKDIYSDNENKTYISEKSAISGATITENEVKKINNTISKFLQYCKDGNAQEAYKMISDDCKKVEYDTIEKFKEKYLNQKFSKNDIYQIENWIRNTYKVSISEDSLATGNINSNKRVEYITIVNEENAEKLNINSYIESKEINKEKTQNNIKITAISKKIYMDYEIYDFEIENLSSKTIKINSLQKTGDMYLEDKKGNTYNAYMHEIFEEDLEIKSGINKNLAIKYANTYSSKTEIQNIIFENIILDYVKYKTTSNKSEFSDICEIKINI